LLHLVGIHLFESCSVLGRFWVKISPLSLTILNEDYRKFSGSLHTIAPNWATDAFLHVIFGLFSGNNSNIRQYLTWIMESNDR